MQATQTGAFMALPEVRTADQQHVTARQVVAPHQLHVSLLKLLLAGCFPAPPTPQSSQSEEAVVAAAGEAPSFKPADATGLMLLLLPSVWAEGILAGVEE